MAHQTFYIDIDEEITSIVDRLRKSKAKEVVIVVPKRALLIQSIVNLKLLKKESDSMKKELIMVTQDKLGKLLVEKTGIAVQQKLDEIEKEEDMMPELDNGSRSLDADAMDFEVGGKPDVKKLLENMGSAEYFEEVPKNKRSKIAVSDGKYGENAAENSVEERIVNKELVTEIGEVIKKDSKKRKSSSFDIVKNIDIKQSGIDDIAASGETVDEFNPDDYMQQYKTEPSRAKKGSIKLEYDKLEEIPEDKFEKLFQPEKAPKYTNKTTAPEYGNVNLSGKFWKYFTVFGSIIIFAIAVSAAYLFLPEVEIKIFARTKSQSVDAQIKGDVNQLAVDLDRQVIPAKTISISDQLAKEYPVTGSKPATSQKARGAVTIYNEYSSSPQTLVATTRLESPDGKIFRLTKTIAVPGVTSVNGESKPGVIEVDVIADEAGDSYNIGPTTFTIPGFKDSGAEKYSKFHGKSSKSMTGGGNNGGTAKSLTADDINKAKNKSLDSLIQSLKEKLKESSGSDLVILDDAVNITDATYTVSNSEGEIVDNFTVIVNAKATAITFSEKDLRDVLSKDIVMAGSGTDQINKDSLVLQYGKTDTDFTDGAITIRVNASGKINPSIDLENLKRGILGKTEDEFMAYLKTYSSIEKAEINYWPSFISGKIPAYESRVKIELDNN